jgi:hypothetical protein
MASWIRTVPEHSDSGRTPATARLLHDAPSVDRNARSTLQKIDDDLGSLGRSRLKN